MDAAKRNTKLGYIIFALGALFYCYEYFLRIAPGVMQHQLIHTFQINATLFGTLSAFYFYAYTPMQLFVGLIVDRYSVRKVMMLAIFACAFGSFLMGNTEDYLVAAAGRFLQGFGSAFAFVGALKLTSMWLRHDRFAYYSGLVNMLGFLGACIGTISMQALVEQMGWHTTIQVFTVLGAALMFAFWLTTRKPPSQVAKTECYDFKTKANSIKESFKQLIDIMKIPKMWFTGLFAGLMFLPTSVFAALWGVPYLEKLHHYTPHHASLATSMIFLGWALGALATGGASDLLGKRVPLLRIGSFIALLLCLPLLYVKSLPFSAVCIMFGLFGAFSSVQILSFVIAKDISPSHSAIGTAVAFINTITMLGGMFFQRGLGQLLDWSWSGQTLNGDPIYSLHDYQIAISVVPVSVGFAFILSLFLKDTWSTQETTIIDMDNV